VIPRHLYPAIPSSREPLNTLPLLFRVTAQRDLELGVGSGGIPLLQHMAALSRDAQHRNHYVPTPLNIGTGDPALPVHESKPRDGLDLSYSPEITVCKKDLTPGGLTNLAKTQRSRTGFSGRQFAHIANSRDRSARLADRAPLFPQWLSQELY